MVIPTLTQVDASAKFDVGTRFQDEEGRVYIYLQGIGSVAKGSWVTYYITSVAASVTALIAGNAIGLVAVALSAVIADTFGWFQIAGNNLYAGAASGGDAAAGAAVYIAAGNTTDDVKVTGDLIVGAVYSIQEGALSGTPAAFAGVTLNYPSVNNVIPTA